MVAGRALRIAAKDNLAPRPEIQLRYAIGKYFDDLGQYEPAFAQYQRANELSRRHRPPYDRARAQQDTDRLIRGCDGRWLEQARVHGVASSLPVFIVGMPRSGTSLAEQILASHPAVFGAGELTFWHDAWRRLEQSNPEGALDKSLVADIARGCLERLERTGRRVRTRR